MTQQQQQTAPVATYQVGDAVIIQPSAPIARLGIAGTPARGVVAFLVTDTEPHPTRGPLYHIRLTAPDAVGWLGLGVARNYADELALDPDATPEATAATAATATAAMSANAVTSAAPHDGERLGLFTFDVRADYLAHAGGLWVLPACYGRRDALRDCCVRVASLTETFGIAFFALHIREDYLTTGGASHAIDCPGWYPATTAEHTAALRRIVTRGLDRARAMAPRSDSGAESEA